jgi:exosome complex protein LRP1
MDITDITPQLDDLGASIDNLEAALKPLIDDVGSVASKLPLLDKAKLNVMTCYAIESLLFCKCLCEGYVLGLLMLTYICSCPASERR